MARKVPTPSPQVTDAAAKALAALGKQAAEDAKTKAAAGGSTPTGVAAPNPSGSIDYGAGPGVGAGPAKSMSYALQALLGDMGFSGEAGLEAGMATNVDVSGMSTSAKRGKIVTIPQALTSLDSMSTAEISMLQHNLYAAGFYADAYYRAGGPDPTFGDRYGDDGLLHAFATAMSEELKVDNKVPFDQLLVQRAVQKKPLIDAKAQEITDRAQAVTDRATAASDREVAIQESAQAKAERAQAQKDAYGPKTVEQSRQVSIPAVSEIGRTVDDVATRLLGRTASDAERADISQMIQDSYRQYAIKQVDVASFNSHLNDPYSTVQGATATNPQLNPMSAQPPAPDSQYDTSRIRTDGSADARVTGLVPQFGSALVAFQTAAQAAGFDIVVRSGHRTEAEQAALFAKSDKSGKMVGTAKGSKHVSGEAVDLSVAGVGWLGAKGTEAATKWAHDNAAKFGLTFPMSYEKWQIEPVTARDKGATMPLIAGSSSLSAKTGGSVSWRNNNPGNLKYGQFAKSNGATGKDSAGFAIFPSEEAGTAAQIALLGSNKYNSKTLAGAVDLWAPPGKDNPYNANYVAGLAAALGVTPDTPMSQIDKARLAAAQRQQEGWKPGVSRPTVGTNPPVPDAAGPGGSVARGVTPYNGAELTASGGLALTEPTVDPAGVAEARFRANNQPEIAGQQMIRAHNIYERLFRGN